MNIRRWVIGVVALCVTVCAQGAATSQPVGDPDQPGRRVKVAAIAIGFGGQREPKLKLGLEDLRVAGERHVDIACLPEEFTGLKGETIPGPTTEAVAAVAKQYHMYVVCPIREMAEGIEYNTAALIDREGKIVGTYRKVFPVWGEKVHPSPDDAHDGVKAFDTDFGRIGILTCFDLNFPELWQRSDQLGVEAMFWPSAYGGGMPLNGMAMLYNYWICPVGKGNLIDNCGQQIAEVETPRENVFIATFDLDRTWVHKDFNYEKVDKLLKEHAGEIEMERDCKMEGCWLLRSIKPGVRVLDLLKQNQIETLREYRHRSREGINEARREGKAV